jgi:tRNA-specific 2-thiouridylase
MHRIARRLASASDAAQTVDACLAAVEAELALLRARLGLGPGAPLRLALGLSGGVDSSLAAALLLRASAPPTLVPVFMKNWEETDERDGECTFREERTAARAAAAALRVPLAEVDFVRQYWGRVFSPFLATACAGGTPNPDLACNAHIKFGALAHWAASQRCDAVTTGHYARLRPTAPGRGVTGGPPAAVQLLRAADASKDQSYFLASVPGAALARALFPLGGLDKAAVRAAAAALGLPSARRRSSAGICFVGRRSFGDFIGGYISATAGDFVAIDAHCGAAEASCGGPTLPAAHAGQERYTHGQGARLGGAADAWFVAGKVRGGDVLLCSGKDHPALFCRTAVAGGTFWVAGSPPGALLGGGVATLLYKARYAQPPAEATAQLLPAVDQCSGGDWRPSVACIPLSAAQAAVEGGDAAAELRLRFAAPARAVTPGQAVVLYDGDVCLGGGMLRHPGPSLFEEAAATRANVEL